jgi:hypothetical protein
MDVKWITRANVKVDRVACPWLIRKFVDKEAEFYFVPAEQVTNRLIIISTPAWMLCEYSGHASKTIDRCATTEPRQIDGPSAPGRVGGAGRGIS